MGRNKRYKKKVKLGSLHLPKAASEPLQGNMSAGGAITVFSELTAAVVTAAHQEAEENFCKDAQCLGIDPSNMYVETA